MDLTRIVRTHITTGELNPPAELITCMCCFLSSQRILSSSSALDNGAVPLTDVVRALGEYLTSTEDETRLKGTHPVIPVERQADFQA
jgi:DNA repair/transcription protein MET18/MMS19